jgi:hypothetical protein
VHDTSCSEATDDANLVMRLYDLRREEKLRRPRGSSQTSSPRVWRISINSAPSLQYARSHGSLLGWRVFVTTASQLLFFEHREMLVVAVAFPPDRHSRRFQRPSF